VNTDISINKKEQQQQKSQITVNNKKGF